MTFEFKETYTLEEQRENRKLWSEALRSGKYKKGRSQLKYEQDDSFYYCCLGVLGEILGVENESAKVLGFSGKIEYLFLSPEFSWDGEKRTISLDSTGKSTAGCPLAAANAVGLRTEAGHFTVPDSGDPDSLWRCNDDRDAGLTFEQIADIIDFEPEGLFVE